MTMNRAYGGMQVETVRCYISIGGTLCIPLRCCSTRGKEWSYVRGLFYEGGYIYLDSKVSFQAGFHTSIESEITQFRSKDLLTKRALNCERMSMKLHYEVIHVHYTTK